MTKKKICLIAGTRPEIIKVAPVIKRFRENSEIFNVVFCATGQHKEMAEQAMEMFGLSPDFNLEIMSENQTLNTIAERIFQKLPKFFEIEKPDLVFVQGDTTTAAVAALVAFNMKIPVAHIEAGLRTYNNMAPYPEEVNRKIISSFSTFNYVPTETALKALLKENISPDSIVLTGNTVVDALEYIKSNNDLNLVFSKKFGFQKPFILLTAHRRENFGSGFENICEAISEIAMNYPGIDIVYPVHMNPNVRNVVYKYLSEKENVHLIEPVGYIELLALLNKCVFCVTDSGGIQEEAPSFGKYTIVLREFTERMESVYSGGSELVGTDSDKIHQAIEKRLNILLSDENTEIIHNPFGQGKASQIIFDSVNRYFR